MSRTAKYLRELQARGALGFTSSEFTSSLGLSSSAAHLALHRLRKQGLIATPARGFHLILRPTDNKAACLPPEEFIDYLMRHFGLPYYVSLLSAAEIYGAAHHRPQMFQVMIPKTRRAVRCGAVVIDFYRNAKLENAPITKHKVRTGYINVSTPEATAFDLIGYHNSAGGLNNVATVLSELSESLSTKKLKSVSKLYSPQRVQRLGFVLENIGEDKLASSLESIVKKTASRRTSLIPGKDNLDATFSERWQMYINVKLEPEL